MQNPVIKSTDDYSIFNIVDFNREKVRVHIENLKEAIQRENLLHLHPILVNEQMEVIDGQHRLAAAKELGVPIFYIKEKLSYDHILNSNQYQRKMGITDILNFYAKRDKNPHYVAALKCMKNAGLLPKAFFGLILGGAHDKTNNLVKSGKFQMPEDRAVMEMLLDNYLAFVDRCKEKRVTPLSMFKSAQFTKAIRSLFLDPGFSLETLLSKVDLKWFEICPQGNSQKWLQLLIKIYNFRNPNPIQNYEE